VQGEKNVEVIRRSGGEGGGRKSGFHWVIRRGGRGGGGGRSYHLGRAERGNGTRESRGGFFLKRGAPEKKKNPRIQGSMTMWAKGGGEKKTPLQRGGVEIHVRQKAKPEVE